MVKTLLLCVVVATTAFAADKRERVTFTATSSQIIDHREGVNQYGGSPGQDQTNCYRIGRTVQCNTNTVGQVQAIRIPYFIDVIEVSGVMVRADGSKFNVILRCLNCMMITSKGAKDAELNLKDRSIVVFGKDVLTGRPWSARYNIYSAEEVID